MNQTELNKEYKKLNQLIQGGNDERIEKASAKFYGKKQDDVEVFTCLVVSLMKSE